MSKLYTLLLGICLFICASVTAQGVETEADTAPAPAEKVSAADARAEAKDAAYWLKEHMALRKKVLSLLKKVKNEKTASKSAKAIDKLLNGENAGKKTALGEVGEAPGMPLTAAMKQLLEKNKKKIVKSNRELLAEEERIMNLELEEDPFSEYIQNLVYSCEYPETDCDYGDDGDE